MKQWEMVKLKEKNVFKTMRNFIFVIGFLSPLFCNAQGIPHKSYDFIINTKGNDEEGQQLSLYQGILNDYDWIKLLRDKDYLKNANIPFWVEMPPIEVIGNFNLDKLEYFYQNFTIAYWNRKLLKNNGIRVIRKKPKSAKKYFSIEAIPYIENDWAITRMSIWQGPSLSEDLVLIWNKRSGDWELLSAFYLELVLNEG
jgi:hypothetical protein